MRPAAAADPRLAGHISPHSEAQRTLPWQLLHQSPTSAGGELPVPHTGGNSGAQTVTMLFQVCAQGQRTHQLAQRPLVWRATLVRSQARWCPSPTANAPRSPHAERNPQAVHEFTPQRWGNITLAIRPCDNAEDRALHPWQSGPLSPGHPRSPGRETSHQRFSPRERKARTPTHARRKIESEGDIRRNGEERPDFWVPGSRALQSAAGWRNDTRHDWHNRLAIANAMREAASACDATPQLPLLLSCDFLGSHGETEMPLALSAQPQFSATGARRPCADANCESSRRFTARGMLVLRPAANWDDDSRPLATKRDPRSTGATAMAVPPHQRQIH
jgi:hypothetical protein